MADQLVGQQHPELPHNHGVELAFTMLSLSETIRASSHTRTGSGEEARRSGRTLNPCPDIQRSACSNTSRRHMK